MCDRGASIAPIAALVVLAGAPVAAQDLARLRVRADSLLEVWRDTVTVADMEDSLRALRGGSGGRLTVRAGALVISANPSPLPLRAAAARAWAQIDSLFGAEAEAALAGRPLVLEVIDEADTTRRREPVTAKVRVPATIGLEDLARTLVMVAPVAPADRSFQEWLGGPILHAVPLARQHAGVYVELVTASADAVRSCFAGDVARCRDALTLSSESEPWRRWYSPAERAGVIRESFAYYFGRGKTEAQFTACTARRDDSACVELFRAIPKPALRPPLSLDARRTLVRLALRLGGRAAYGRLLRPTGGDAAMADRLALAAGIPVDSLVAVWRAEVMAARPQPVTLPLWAVAIPLGWVAVFGACSLRSSRWRLT